MVGKEFIDGIKEELRTLNAKSCQFDCLTAIAYLSGRLPGETIDNIYEFFSDVFIEIEQKRFDYVMNLTLSNL